MNFQTQTIVIPDCSDGYFPVTVAWKGLVKTVHIQEALFIDEPGCVLLVGTCVFDCIKQIEREIKHDENESKTMPNMGGEMK